MQSAKRRRTDALATDVPIVLRKALDEPDVACEALDDLEFDDAIDYAAELANIVSDSDSDSEEEAPLQPLDLAALWEYHFDYHARGN
jgi:hypothetical protein